ncbi:MAG TPA: hypothetical protein VD813_09115 [Pseudonocardia sp.]|nr:hypothetical protein [Pseudonocardia sp.]
MREQEHRGITVAEMHAVTARLIGMGHGDDTLGVWGDDAETALRVACHELRVWALVETYPRARDVGSPLDLLRELPRIVRPPGWYPRHQH